MQFSRVAAIATVLALATALTACGDDDKDSDADEKVTETVSVSPSASETTSAPPTTEATEATEATTSVTPMDPSSDVTIEELNAALLTPEEIAPGLVLGTWTDENSPPPCDPTGTPADLVVPPALEGGTEITTPDGNAYMTEVIAVYETAELATEAFAVNSEGLNCTTATAEDGTTATIGPATDVTAQVNTSGIGTSTGWDLSGDGFTGVLVATQIDRVLMATTFIIGEGADVSSLPQALDIAEAAVAKAIG